MGPKCSQGLVLVCAHTSFMGCSDAIASSSFFCKNKVRITLTKTCKSWHKSFHTIDKGSRRWNFSLPRRWLLHAGFRSLLLSGNKNKVRTYRSLHSLQSSSLQSPQNQAATSSLQRHRTVSPPQFAWWTQYKLRIETCRGSGNTGSSFSSLRPLEACLFGSYTDVLIYQSCPTGVWMTT